MLRVAPKKFSSEGVVDRLGRPLHDLRISVIDNCNLRCPYCMPQSEYGDSYQFLHREELLTFAEIEVIARAFVRLGVSKLRLTGGEPLLRKDLPQLVERLAAIAGVDDLALTTNGLLLPRLARPLKEAGLHRVTVSLDSLDDSIFGRMSGRGVTVAPILKGIDAALEAGLGPVKINTVIQRGINDGGILDLAGYFRGRDCILRFIEYMDVGNQNGWRRDQVVPSREIREKIHARFPLRAAGPNYLGEVASRYVYEDGAGEIGFVSSVTQTFCGSCSRARLSADGKVFTCLFASTGADLRAFVRRGAPETAMRDRIEAVWSNRIDRYSELRSAQSSGTPPAKKIEMYQIGG